MTLKPSLGDYREIGAELNSLCDRLTKLSCKLGQQTGVTKAPYNLSKNALQALDRCKSETDILSLSTPT